MAIVKPEIPSSELPNTWGGTQTPYSTTQIENGYEEAIPQIVDGGNVNYEKKGLFENIKYLRIIADYVRGLPIGKGLIVNKNNQLDYGKVAPDGDGKSITENANGQIQTVGIIDNNNNAIKTWTGTQARYDGVATKDDTTLYAITDDVDTGTDLLQIIYPVGSLYLTTNATCPLANLFGTWVQVSTSSNYNEFERIA